MRIEVRTDSVLVDGYVNAVERDSKILTDTEGKHFVEQIMAGCFSRAIEKNPVKILLNHQKDRILGDTDSNLKLEEDAIGLHARAIITDPEVIALGRSESLKGWSFGFRNATGTAETLSEDLYRRRIEDLDLIEVTLVAAPYTPAYNGTLVEVRADEDLTITEPLETRMDYMVETPKEPVDYSEYYERIAALERGKDE